MPLSLLHLPLGTIIMSERDTGYPLFILAARGRETKECKECKDEHGTG